MKTSVKGFSLLEIVVALLLLSLGTIFILKSFNAGVYASADIEAVELARHIAQAKMEALKNTAFASLADSGPTADADFPNYTVTTDVAEGTEPMQVDVTVAWNEKKGQTSITLTTLRSNY